MSDLQDWQERAARSTSCDMVDDILQDWAKERDALLAEVTRLQDEYTEKCVAKDNYITSLIEKKNRLQTELTRLREEYKVHEQKYAVPGWWHPGDGVSGPREPILGFIVTPEEGAGIRAMVADHDTIQTELTRLRGLIRALGTMQRYQYRPGIYDLTINGYRPDMEANNEGDWVRYDNLAALLREVQR